MLSLGAHVLGRLPDWLSCSAEKRMRAVIRGAALAMGLATFVLLPSCDDAESDAKAPILGGNSQRGAQLIGEVGCGSCHIIPGIDGASGLVGPPLYHMRNRVVIAGVLRNTPENLVSWLRNPQRIVPGNAMPNMELSEKEARDIAAYLYTLE